MTKTLNHNPKECPLISFVASEFNRISKNLLHFFSINGKRSDQVWEEYLLSLNEVQ
jgi:hypothetical protein